MPQLIQQLVMAIGFNKQAGIGNSLPAADMWVLRTTNSDVPQPDVINESDKDDYGKGVYATQLFPSHLDSNFPINGRLSSEWFAMLTAFGIGKTAKTTAGDGFLYTSETPDIPTDGLDLPVTSIAVKIGTVTDKMLLDMALNEWTIQLNSGPGRNNATFTSNWMGSGAFLNPSAITYPAATAEHALNAGGATSIIINGINYLSSKRFSTAEFGMRNNIRGDRRYYPGSGTQSGFQKGGRIQRGVPEFFLRCRVDAEAGSAEEDNLLDQVSGTAVITLAGAEIGAGPEVNEAKATFQKIIPKTTKVTEIDGIATYDVDFEILEHASNGVVTFEATCEQDGILEAGA